MMVDDDIRHQRRSIRLQSYDYSKGGAYFVTICTHKHFCLLLEPGPRKMIDRVWEELPRRYRRLRLDAFVIMPNHVHATLVLSPRIIGPEMPARRAPAGIVRPSFETESGGDAHSDSSCSERQPCYLGDVICAFKSLTSCEYIRGVRELNWRPFEKRLWQRNYYERVVRNDRELFRIRDYITNNPKTWESDRENPQRTGCNEIYEWLYS